ncbi:MAG: NUDIX hydrolase [Sulfuricurvum sp.]|uniref:NUDIX domain-containing protein n=1 Tax=Sulfuricurvum sp. TaxID=2025608 RepID=UPI0027375125|nr:NUDIX hydrolase [Sulfuricurvum sp.]MDP2850325.1 NUDIX hydrolase [Sulfuricurvum sp.]MDP3290594.1 NUDIX hydrolase [Sulfuricurvum sp.]
MHTRRVPFGFIDHDKKNAVFLAIYVESISPWKYFKDDMQHLKCPALIMIDRWDGRMGFPGGTVDKNETLMDALVREIKEEVGITIKPSQIDPIASHESRIVTHLYGLKVLEAEFLHIYYHILNNFARSILLHAYEEGDESHFMSEITGIKIVPLVQHENKGINRFLENAFAGATREDLDVLLHDVLHLSI